MFDSPKNYETLNLQIDFVVTGVGPLLAFTFFVLQLMLNEAETIIVPGTIEYPHTPGRRAHLH